MDNQEKKCFLAINGKQVGPLSDADVLKLYEDKIIAEDTHFIKVGMEAWIKLSDSGIIPPLPVQEYVLPPLPSDEQSSQLQAIPPPSQNQSNKDVVLNSINASRKRTTSAISYNTAETYRRG